ncbi:hypothetical protein BGZ72_001201, partial [Mortierella alpina]
SCLALPALTELYFGDFVEMRWDYSDKSTVSRDLKTVIDVASIVRFPRGTSAKKIKSLKLPSNRAGLWNPLPLLLLVSSLLDLERCEIPWFDTGVDIREVEQVVREHCPNLKHLSYPFLAEEWEEPASWNSQAACAFIRGCTALQSFDSPYFNDHHVDEPRLIIPELVSRHHSTLEVFKLVSPYEVLSCDLQDILSRCKNLKQFWVMRESEEEIIPGIAFKDISRSTWVCSELRELGITLNRCRRERDTSGDLGEEEEQDDPYVWLTASTTKRVYQQIGRLEKLEILAIDIDRSNRTRATENDYRWDLTLWKGWLGELAGLKNLKSLRLRVDFWSNMRQFEVEFMHEHWPLLRELAFSCDISQFHTEPQWRWLLEKRPHLRLVRLED